MIPFHKIYSWFFKSFSIGEETKLLEKLHKNGYTKLMLVKRSWIYILFVSWMPILIVLLSCLSIWIAIDSVDIIEIKYTIIIGNIVMNLILFPSTFSYIQHFREVHKKSSIIHDPDLIIREVEKGDEYFIRFFNWSLTNQFLLSIIIVIEIGLVVFLRQGLGQHFFILLADTLVIIAEIHFLRAFRKNMIDLEMDFNIVVPGKLYTANQTGVLSNTQTIDGDKIKTVRAIFPNKIASFFNFGNIDILTEGDEGMLGAITLYFVTSPKDVAHDIELMLGSSDSANNILSKNPPSQHPEASKSMMHSDKNRVPTSRHSLDTREKIRDILR